MKLLVITLFFIAILLLIFGYHQIDKVCSGSKPQEETIIEILKQEIPEQELNNFYTQKPGSTFDNYFKQITPWIKNIPPITPNIILSQHATPLQF